MIVFLHLLLLWTLDDGSSARRVGAAGVLGFDYAMHATSTDEFCLSCHELADNVGKAKTK